MNIINRAVKLASLPVTTGAKYAASASKAAIMKTPGSQAALDATSAAIIEKITATLAATRGPAMKFGQTLAMISVALPEDQAELLAPLTRLYDSADPRAWSEIEFLVSDLTDWITIDPSPIAAASLGQVHKGVTSDGHEVAIKIQYPDAKKAVKADGLQLKALAPLLSIIAPSLDFSALVKEHIKRLEEELDYTLEAANLVEFRKAWLGVVTIPEVVYSSPTVLVTSYLSGESLNDSKDLDQNTRNKIAFSVLDFAFSSPTKIGATHADPHPGNYKICEDGTLGVLDFGAVSRPSGGFTRLLCDTLVVKNSMDTNPLWGDSGASLIKKRWVEEGMALENIDKYQLIEAIGIRTDLVYGKVRLNNSWLQNAGGDWSNPVKALEKINSLSFPPSFLLEHRALGGALALACSLDAVVDISDIIYSGISDEVKQQLPFSVKELRKNSV